MEASGHGVIPREILESMSQRGISSLTPPQESAIASGLLSGTNMVVASPTASGKTLIAEIACMNAILKGRKAIYIAPMRALASEKFSEFKESYPYVSSVLSIGDLDSNDLWLKEFKMLFFSTEKFDSLLRHGMDWLGSIGCIVFDEVHMLEDSSRGPTLELLITKLSMMCDAQMVALSATIGNAAELARWMNAALVESDYRPVKLEKGVLHDGIAYYKDRKDSLAGKVKVPEVRVAEDVLERHKQALVFFSTKRGAEAGAVRLSEIIKSRLSREDLAELERVSSVVLNALDRPTEQCRKLSGLVANGVAFHHSGLLNKQRTAIENAFRANRIKAICSTTTLGFGVNTPAHTVLVRDTSRFSGGYSEKLGVNEITQLFGRAGRPKYDKEGRALIAVSAKDRVDDMLEYISRDPEPINSSLGIAPVLRTHVLAFIAEDFINSETALEKFMAKTFYSHQYGSASHINRILEEVIDELDEWGFIDADGGRFTATRLGKRVSELYIDPMSAKWIVDMLTSEPDSIGMLYMISNTLEMRPHVKATREAEEMYYSLVNVMNVPMTASDDYPEKAFSTALMLRDWMDEKREQEIMDKYSTTPGALYTKITNADWLLYASSEIARILRMPQRELMNIRVRMRYGIKEELLDLVRLEQIGRVRARALYINGIRKASEILPNREKVSSILGKEVAERVFAQLQ